MATEDHEGKEEGREGIRVRVSRDTPRREGKSEVYGCHDRWMMRASLRWRRQIMFYF